MEQVYWLSTPLEPGDETRNLVYRYGRFVYAGAVITEPVAGLDYLPGVLQGIQAVQGQIPYVCEFSDLTADSPHAKALRTLAAAIDTIHSEVVALEPRVAELAADGASWLEEDDAAVYFEFEARAEHTCFGSDVVFAKSYRGDVLLTIIWYGPAGRYYVSLTPAGGEEQALVDTLFPSIYGKRRGAALATYAPPADLPLEATAAFTGEEGVAAAAAALEAASSGAAAGGAAGSDGKDGDASDSKTAERAKAAGLKTSAVLPAWKLFSGVSVWEASEPVPDPDELRAQDDAEDDEGEDEEGDDEEEGEVDDAAIDVGEDPAAATAAAGALLGDELDGGLLDLSGGSGYTQVYAVMSPAPAALAAAGSASARSTGVPAAGAAGTAGAGAAGAGLIPRTAVFRFGDWVYAGQVDFPVEALRLGDVPFVLPALQKQQGRLAFLSEAKAFPLGHPMTPVMQSFMSAVALLRAEMEACQEEVAALAEQGVNAWIDADWAASFFELAFAPGSIPPPLAGVEVIACKIYLHAGAGVILHVVYFAGSLYCVLADSVEDLPLLDVAFPDVTARNRVVQVRTYDEKGGRRLAATHAIRPAGPPGSAGGAAASAGSGAGKEGKDVDTGLCPVPVSLRVWEGRRKGIPGVGYGAALALADDKAGAAAAIREKARLRAEAEAKAAAAAAAAAKAKAAPKAAEAAAAASDSKADAEPAVPAPVAAVAAAPAPAAVSSASASVSAAASEGKEPDGGAADGPLGRMGGLAAALPARSAGAGAASDGKAGEGGAAGAGAEEDDSAWHSGAGGMSRDPTLRNRGAAAIPSALLHSVARGPHHLAPLKRAGGAEAATAAAGGAGAADAGNALDVARNRLLVPAGSFGGEAEESKLADAPWDASGRPRGR